MVPTTSMSRVHVCGSGVAVMVRVTKAGKLRWLQSVRFTVLREGKRRHGNTWGRKAHWGNYYSRVGRASSPSSLPSALSSPGQVSLHTVLPDTDSS